ncbi:hypothetical protein L6303_04630, partial [archaeon]|nr:hypothetical protein [archaeon]
LNETIENISQQNQSVAYGIQKNNQNETNENKSIENKTFSKLSATEESSHEPAEVGKPVKWHKTIQIQNNRNINSINQEIELSIPASAENIQVFENNKLKASGRKWIEPLIKAKETKEYYIEYETPAPEMNIKGLSEKERPQDTNRYDVINIYHDDENGTMHYYNVTVKIPYDEKYDVLWKNGFMDIVWLNGTEKFFSEPTSVMKDPAHNVHFIDSNGNGINDTLVFTVPELSAADYGLPGYSCEEYDQTVGYTAIRSETKNYNWTPNYNCLGSGLNCQMVNFTINRRYADVGNAVAAYVQLVHPNTTSYYVSYAADIDSVGCTPPYNATTELIDWNWTCRDSCGGVVSPLGTCNMSKMGFNASSYTVRLVAGNFVLVDVLQIKHTWCWQEAKPQLSNPLLKSESAASWGATTTGGWGERFYFNISVVDPQGDNVNLTLKWNHSANPANNFEYLNNTLCTSCTPERNATLNYKGFACTNADTSVLDTDVFFRINASDNSTTTENNSWGPDLNYYFTIDKDDINSNNITPAWNMTVNRSQAYNFTIQLIDSDRAVSPTSSEIQSTETPIYISKFGSNETFETYYVAINSSGYLNKEMKNISTSWCQDFFYVGQNYWKGGVSSAACFKNNLTQPSPSNAIPFMLYGSFKNTLIFPDGSANFSRGTDTITFNGSVYDDCGAEVTSGVSVTFKMKQGVTEYTCSASYVGSVWKCSISPDYSYTTGYYNVTMMSNKTYYYNGSANRTNAFYLKSIPLLENTAVTPSADGWGSERNFSVNVTDNTGDTVTVYLWEEVPASSGNWIQIGNSQQCNSPCSGNILWWTKNYTCTNFVDYPSRNFKFNATDTPEGNVQQTSSTPFTLQKDNIRIDYVSGNETTATLSIPTNFSLRAFDITRNNYNISEALYMKFNVTKAGQSSPYYTLTPASLSNTTGHANYSFLPDGSFSIGKQNWTGFIDTVSSGCYNYNESQAYNVTTTGTNIPQIWGEFVDVVVGGWGDTRRFNVTVNDSASNATVRLWKSTSTGGPWTQVNWSYYNSSGSAENISFVQNFPCTAP